MQPVGPFWGSWRDVKKSFGICAIAISGKRGMTG